MSRSAIASCAMSNKNLISDWDHCFCMYTSFHDQHEHYMTWQKKKILKNPNSLFLFESHLTLYKRSFSCNCTPFKKRNFDFKNYFFYHHNERTFSASQISHRCVMAFIPMRTLVRAVINHSRPQNRKFNHVL